MTSFDWPVLQRYDAAHLARIALPIGGIGTGTIALGGRGDLRDWELVNRPAKGFSPRQTFWALHVRGENQAVTRCLEGPLDLSLYETADGHRGSTFGLPRFREARFEAAYPFGQVILSDPDVPLQVRLQAFNPFVPGDTDASSLPIAVLRWVLHNPTSETLQASVCGSLANFIGSDGTNGQASQNHNEWRDAAGVRGVFAHSHGLAPDHPASGTVALCALDEDAQVSHRTAWARLSWGDPLLDFWDDFSADGHVDERDQAGAEAPMLSLCSGIDIAPGETRALTFLLAWHFPNRMTWTPCEGDPNEVVDAEGIGSGAHRTGPPIIGNFYTTQFADAWDVARQVAPLMPDLEAKTLAFARAFYESDLPDVVKEAAGFNLSTLRTQTCFRTPDGHLFGWEGIFERDGSCYGSCTHVWNYEQALAHLFGPLARSMREIEFLHATRPDGHMSFRVGLPLKYAAKHELTAADGQMGCVMKLWRDWKLCGDDAWLAGLWPQARRALRFCWTEGGWDADHDGVMEGCQHNTMDVEYFGPNPQMQGWYLGALRAGEEMARRVGDPDFAATCRDLFERGRAWTDANLWNGDYYEQEIRPALSLDAIAPGMRHGRAGAQNVTAPDFQLGAGCLIDQLVGPMMARVCDLGDLLDPAHVSQTLASILRFNRRENLHGHFNHLRSYALGDESALLMASFPKGRRPARPFPYYNEVMTGFEYTVAVHLLYENEVEAGLKVIRDIRARYDGRKRNPFDETECGRHYARALCSWGAVLALTGFAYDASRGELRFNAAPQPATWFWSNGAAWGVVEQQPQAGGISVTLRVQGGTLPIRRLELNGFGAREWDEGQNVATGQALACLVGPGARAALL